eukprot:scaffold90121_cov30-Tisochrysis_lutea.AAC.2
MGTRLISNLYPLWAMRETTAWRPRTEHPQRGSGVPLVTGEWGGRKGGGCTQRAAQQRDPMVMHLWHVASDAHVQRVWHLLPEGTKMHLHAR